MGNLVMVPESILYWKIRRMFNEVSHIDTNKMQLWLDNEDDMIIYDVREINEYEVSHLANAIQINLKDDDDQLKVKLPEDKNKKIVCYCSVGYRSSILAKRLMKLGYTNVYNLEGSIFKWANEQRYMIQYSNNENAIKVTKQVHPYDEKWGKYVKEQYRAHL